MKKWLKAAVVTMLLLCIGSRQVTAQENIIQEQMESSGALDLWEALDEQTRELYWRIGVEDIHDLSDGVTVSDDWWTTLQDMVREQGTTPFTLTGILLAAVVLCAYVGGAQSTTPDSGMTQTYQSVCVLSVGAVVLVPFVQCVRTVRAAVEGAAVFMGSFSPVYVATLAANGSWKTAISYQSVLLLFSQILTFVTKGILLPLLLSSLALGVVSCISDGAVPLRLGDTLLKGLSRALGVIAAIFTAWLTLNGMLGSAGDSFTNRLIKLSLSGLVPVVGSALSEAFLTVRGCAEVVRTTVGGFGVVTTFLLVLPSLVQCVCWQICLWICGVAADAFHIKVLSDLFGNIRQTTKTMIALLSVCTLFMLVATVIVARGVG